MGSVPFQFVHVVKERDVGAERGERSEQQGVVAFAGECAGESAGVGGVDAPLAPVRRDGFDVDEFGENGRRRFRSPAGKPG